MGRFTNGVILGVGISFLFAPQTGQETRRFLRQRLSHLRGNPPENEGLKQQVQQKADQAAQMGSTVQNYAQETAKSVNSVQSDLRNVAQETGSDVTAARLALSRQQNQPGRQG
jgi:gas vesicle protein